MTKKLLNIMKTKRSLKAYLKNSLLVLAFILAVTPVIAQKQMENLDRGVLAVRTGSNQVLVSWRIFGTEFTNASYNVYRGTTLLNTTPITGASNYVDNTSTNATYSVSAIIDGIEQEVSQPINVWNKIYKKIPITAPAGGTTPDNVSYTYEANDASVGDLDGDGEYEIILKWYPTNSKDNAQSGYTGNTILQALKMDGTVFWTIDLGKNIRSGAHYTQFMVYDLDGDGKAEIACKTADGTVDGVGTVLGDANADYRTSNGYILTGPEYLSLFNGETGAFITTQNYIPARGSVSSWGDNYGNRVDRFLACVAYLDGARPSLVFCRGYYTRTVLAAYDYRDGQLTNRWVFDSNNSGNGAYAGQGNHNLSVGDLDGDGKDEIQYGSCAIDDNGTGLYTTGFGHGDAAHLGDFDPNKEGLEYFMVHEEANRPEVPQIDFRNPKTGQVFWSVPGSGDIGRGVTADIDPNHLGAESWASNGSGIHNVNGDVISTTYPTTAGNGTTYNMLAWYDGDLLRELVDRTVITKWNAAKGGTDRILTAYNYDNVSISDNNGSKSSPCLIADILGDWREEIIWRKFDNTELVIFSTPNPTTERIFTLMHDPVYRTSIAWQNVAYNQPAHTGFYLGVGMQTPASPNIYLANGGTLSVKDSGIKNSSSIKIYPNPTTDELYISGVHSGTIEVYDTMGKFLVKKNANATKRLDLSNYPKGLYLIKITQETEVNVFKAILK
ncbi:T9SS type A sorting domain-containing protein [Mariniflexile soesokkakense]|uniref:T9SS type A sorting domain-containing protein n=2 Tax=Mariniflexile soesokkakense TaxID=1343160 RepID=A0ABV0A9Z9_9FLAO